MKTVKPALETEHTSVKVKARDEDVFVNWNKFAITFNTQLDVTLCRDRVCHQQHGASQQPGFESAAITKVETLFGPPAGVLF